MSQLAPLPIAKTENFLGLLPHMAYRHGLIASATGTDKTVTLRVLAEHFSRIVFFFDDPPEALLDKIEQVVRLIRSKGVGIYFVSQNPLDVPDTILGQLGNRVQHALRAFTPRDQKAVRAAAQTFRPNPALDVEQVITEVGVG